MAIQYKIYFRLSGDSWIHIDDTYDLELATPDAVQDLYAYYSVYEWRVDTYDDVTELTTTGDTWTFISQQSPFSYTIFTRRSDYDPDLVWQPTVGWVNIEDFEYTGGGRLKNRVVVVGHKVIYFGDA